MDIEKKLTFISEETIRSKEVGVNYLSVSYETNNSDEKTNFLPYPNIYDRISQDGKYISGIDCCI